MKSYQFSIFFLFFLSIYPFNNVWGQNTIKGNVASSIVVDETVCLEVSPCDKEGNVLKKYLGGNCHNVYQTRCLYFKLANLSQKEDACSKSLVKKDKKIRKLKNRIKYLSKR